MSDINNRLRKELLEEKTVKCHNRIFRSLFNYIFPNQDKFVGFLSTDIIDTKIDLAKIIYKTIATIEDIILPEYIINDAISVQYKDFVESNKGYIPQDHIIHSINIYVLGIYLFFNYPLFHEKLISHNEVEESVAQKIKRFIKKWKLFSLYHDVGYYLESNIDGKGEIKDPNCTADIEKHINDLSKELCIEYVSRSVARSILGVCFLQNEQQIFESDKIQKYNDKWKGKDGKNTKFPEDLIRRFDGARRINHVQSFASFAHISKMLESFEVLVIVLDFEEHPVGLLSLQKKQFNHYYILKDGYLDNPKYYKVNDYESFSDLLPMEFKCIFYIKDPENIYNQLFGGGYGDAAKNYYHHLPSNLKTQLSFAVNNVRINHCYYTIDRWLLENRYTLQDYSPEDEMKKQDEQLREKYSAELSKQLGCKISNLINKLATFEEKDIEQLIDDFSKEIVERDSKAEIIKKVEEKAKLSFNKTEGNTHDFFALYRGTYKSVSDEIKKKEDLCNRIKCLSLSGNIIALTLFCFDPSYIFASDLYNSIKDKAEQLSVDIDKLKQYKTDHSSCDHGLISAGLLFQSSVYSHILYDVSLSGNKTVSMLKHAWYGENGFYTDKRSYEDYADVIFAILMHNIYTKESKPLFGIEYHHDIDVNPFCYFGAFCDVFQRWNRQKRLNLSRTSLPDDNFLGNDFDLIVSEDAVSLKCSPHDAALIRDYLKKDNEYIDGIINIVDIREY